MMRPAIAAATASIVVAGAAAGGALPSIVHIMGDDVGWNDLGYHNELIASPWIDKLALGGVRLTNHHAFKVCAPSRSGFHTGRLPWQMGYYDNSGAATPWETVDANKLGADTRFKLLPQLLEAKGYVSHAIGKWHLGGATRAYTPTYRGYSTFLGYYHAMTEDYWAHTHSTGSGCAGPGLANLWSDMSNNTGTSLSISPDNGTYESILFGDHAVRTIANHARTAPSRPLFMYAPPNMSLDTCTFLKRRPGAGTWPSTTSTTRTRRRAATSTSSRASSAATPTRSPPRKSPRWTCRSVASTPRSRSRSCSRTPSSHSPPTTAALSITPTIGRTEVTTAACKWPFSLRCMFTPMRLCFRRQAWFLRRRRPHAGFRLVVQDAQGCGRHQVRWPGPRLRLESHVRDGRGRGDQGRDRLDGTGAIPGRVDGSLGRHHRGRCCAEDGADTRRSLAQVL